MEELNKQNANLSGQDENVIKALNCLVDGQESSFVGGEGEVYKSVCKQQNNIAITLITKRDKPLAKVIYDYDSEEEVIIYANKQ